MYILPLVCCMYDVTTHNAMHSNETCVLQKCKIDDWLMFETSAS